MLTALVEEKGARVEIPRSLPHVRGDRIRLREVFTNLISNAIKYNMADTPHVQIGYLEPGERTLSRLHSSSTGGRLFYVSDNGIGIDPKHHEQVFGMFKRLHGRDAYGGGSGAGLSITRKLIEQHGGTVWIESALSQGATFYFTLPQSASEQR
jgi:light-regulated signal transduction histidine kinase (bacteriophytochrome)